MAEWASVGKSHYGDTKGVEQFMHLYPARRINAMIDFIAGLPGCRRMTVSEGRRTRARQTLLRRAYLAFLRGGPWAALAAIEFTSRHDEVLHGNAADLAGPDGSSINAAEQAAIKQHGPAFGVAYTGLLFGELWHVEADERYFPAPPRAPSKHEATEQSKAIEAARKAEAARILHLKKVSSDMSIFVKSKKTGAWYEIFEFSYEKITDHDVARRVVVARNGIASVQLAGSTVRAMLDRTITRRKAFVKAIAGTVADAVLEQMQAEANLEPTGPDVTDADPIVDDVA